jgi:hypothetical protein
MIRSIEKRKMPLLLIWELIALKKATNVAGSNKSSARSKGPSKMAEMIALNGVAESSLPEGIAGSNGSGDEA